MSTAVQPAPGKLSAVIDMVNGMVLGATVVVVTSPMMNCFGNVSVVATRYNIAWAAPFHKVYSGVDGATPNTPLNYFRGIQAHLAKEGSRVVHKGVGLYCAYPWFNKHYSPHWAAIGYSATLSVAEMIISNPPDAIRV